MAPTRPHPMLSTRFSSEIHLHTQAYLDLEGRASDPYNGFVYRDRDQSDSIRRRLLTQHAAEFAPPHGRLLLKGNEPAGMLACLGARDLMRARLRSARLLHADLRADPSLAGRIRLAARALVRLADGDFYLSRVAVAPRARGHGLGRLLVDEYARLAEAAGCSRLVLEVAPSAGAAMAFYQHAGFGEITRYRVDDPDTGRTLEYAHLARPVTGRLRGEAPNDDHHG